MKIQAAKSNVESGGIAFNVKFKIGANAKSFSVLSDGMYSDPIQAMVQELSTNAFDAHQAANNLGQRFQVFCPTGWDPFFGVKDFGTGLRYFRYQADVVNEHEGESTIFIQGDIRNQIKGIDLLILDQTQTFTPSAVLYDTDEDQTILRIGGDFSGRMLVEFDDALVMYTTYFMSTKDQDDQYMGGFGLGSKTPLAYGDEPNFEVTNVFNGWKSIFSVCLIDGNPQISPMGRFQTDEPNGLSVKIAVNPEDHGLFRDAIVNKLKYFEPAPIIVNDEVDMPKVVYRGQHFLLMDRDVGDGRHVNLVLGNNSYNLYDYRIQSNAAFKTNVAVCFGVGELTPTATREDLRLDSDAYDLINKRLSQALVEYQDYILSQLDSGKMSEAEIIEFVRSNSKVIDFNNAKVRELINNPNYIYALNDVKIPLVWGSYTSVEFVEDEDTNEVRRNPARSGRELTPFKFKTFDRDMRKRIGANEVVPYGSERTLFIIDTHHAFLKKIRWYIRENEIPCLRTSHGNQNENQVLMVEENNTEQGKLAMDALLEVLPDINIVRVSDIELPKSATISTSQTREYKTPVGRLKPASTQFNQYWNIRTWDEVYTPLTKIERDENTYIVEMYRNQVVDKPGLERNDLQFLQLMVEDGQVPEDVEIMALSTAKFEKALTYGFRDLSELIKELKDDVVVGRGLAHARAYREVMAEDLNKSYWHSDTRGDRIEALSAWRGLDGELGHAIRIYRVLEKRYGKRHNRWARDEVFERVLNVTPEADPDFLEMLDNFAELCDNVHEHKDTELLNRLNGSRLTADERQELVEFLNWRNSNTGDDNE